MVYSSIGDDEERPRRKANEAWRDGKLLARFPPPHTSTTTAGNDCGHTTADKWPTKRYTNTPLGMKGRSAQLGLHPNQ